MEPPEDSSTFSRNGWRRWFGPSAFIALGVFVLGRLLLEPLRSVPQFDGKGMEAFEAVEIYALRRHPEPIKVVFFGSSMTLWDVVPGVIAEETGCRPEEVRNLASPGGTPFDMWHMAWRNPERWNDVKVAVLEVTPSLFKFGSDYNPRVRSTISQKATLAQRFLIKDKQERALQIAEWAFPLYSVRRSLRSAFLNVIDPDPGLPIFPYADSRLYPSPGWYVTEHPEVEHHTTRAEKPLEVAERFVGKWRLSQLQDRCMRDLLDFLTQRKIPVIFHQPPFDSAVARAIRDRAALSKSYHAYLAYLDSLTPASLVPAPNVMYRRLDAAEAGITPQMVFDRIHLNETGAVVYSRELGRRIRDVLAEQAAVSIQPEPK